MLTVNRKKRLPTPQRLPNTTGKRRADKLREQEQHCSNFVLLLRRRRGGHRDKNIQYHIGALSQGKTLRNKRARLAEEDTEAQSGDAYVSHDRAVTAVSVVLSPSIEVYLRADVFVGRWHARDDVVVVPAAEVLFLHDDPEIHGLVEVRRGSIIENPFSECTRESRRRWTKNVNVMGKTKTLPNVKVLESRCPSTCLYSSSDDERGFSIGGYG